MIPWFELCSSFLASHLIRFRLDFSGLFELFRNSGAASGSGPVAVKSSFLAATRVNRELITCIKAGGFSLQTSLVLQGEASVRGISSGSIAICNKNQKSKNFRIKFLQTSRSIPASVWVPDSCCLFFDRRVGTHRRLQPTRLWMARELGQVTLKTKSHCGLYYKGTEKLVNIGRHFCI
jgi:hypothetical protein